MFEKNLLAAKRILVTGGGSGLGAAMGRRFVELGAELIICGRRLELLEATAAQLRGDCGGKVTAFRCDLRDSAAALIAITACPGSATGSGTSASTRSSGWQYCEQRMAFMGAPDF